MPRKNKDKGKTNLKKTAFQHLEMDLASLTAVLSYYNPKSWSKTQYPDEH